MPESALRRAIVMPMGTLAQSMVHNHMPVCHSTESVHLMAHQKHCGFLRQIGYYVIEPFFEIDVEVTHRFVEDEQRWLRHDGASEKRALKLTARQASDRSPGKVPELDKRKRTLNLLLFLFLRHAAGGKKSGRHNLTNGDGKMRVDGIFLRQVAGTWKPDGGVSGVVIADKLAGRRADESENNSQESGLSTAVRTGDGNEIAAVDGEVYVIEHTASVADKPYVLQRQQVADYWLAKAG